MTHEMKTAEEWLEISSSGYIVADAATIRAIQLDAKLHYLTLAAEIAELSFRINDEGSYSTAIHAKDRILAERDKKTL